MKPFSQSLENTLLLGVNVFDFSNIKDDICTSSLDSKMVQIKVTACSSGQFTCDDGECVSMDERCNQISNCRFSRNELMNSFDYYYSISEMNLMSIIVRCWL